MTTSHYLSTLSSDDSDRCKRPSENTDPSIILLDVATKSSVSHEDTDRSTVLSEDPGPSTMSSDWSTSNTYESMPQESDDCSQISTSQCQEVLLSLPVSIKI